MASARVFKTTAFDRFCRKHAVPDAALLKAVAEIEAGSIHANLGSGLVKQRLPGRNVGKSGGYRTVIAFRAGDRIVFLHGFAKSRQANLSAVELHEYRSAAERLLLLAETSLAKLVSLGVLIRVR